MSGYVVEDAGSVFVLPLAGLVCSEVRGEDLILRSAESAAEAWVSGSEFDEGVMQQLVARGACVGEAIATKSSSLEIGFDGGERIVNPPADEVEAWEVRGPGYVLAVALPGGGEPAIWDDTSAVRIVSPGDPLPPSLRRMIDAFGFPIPTGEFELRCTSGGTESFELHPPLGPLVSRSEIVRFVDTGQSKGDPK
jgi:Family of unknown function (DUF6188)